MHLTSPLTEDKVYTREAKTRGNNGGGIMPSASKEPKEGLGVDQSDVEEEEEERPKKKPVRRRANQPPSSPFLHDR